MKICINKKAKVVLIVLTILLIGIFSFFLNKQIKHRGYEEEKVTLYSYNNKTSIDYKVFLKPNILYGSNSIDKGNIYITEFVDYIYSSFNYEFNGEKSADIEGNYEIIAHMEGIAQDKDNVSVIWKKDFILLPKTNFKTNDKKILISKNIKLYLQKYNDFAYEVMRTTKIKCPAKLTVSMNINLKLRTSEGVGEEKITPSLVIPLNTNYFKISDDLSEEKADSIQKTKQIQSSINKKKVTVYAIAIGILLIALISLIFFTKGVVITDPLEKKLKGIFKKHGDRLVALNSEDVLIFKNGNYVKSIDDLVRIADEIGKPIMYKYSPDFKDITKFYVFDETQIYVLDLKDILTKVDIEELDKSDESEESEETDE